MQHTPPDWRGLLAPVMPDCPTGFDPRTLDLFLRTRDIRNAARNSERQRAQGATCDNMQLQTQWLQIAALCCDLLTIHSKHLDVCAWLIEAWSRLYGLRGIADGFTLYRELLTLYWDDLFPATEANDAAARVSALNALNGSNRAGTLVEAAHYFFVTGFEAAGDISNDNRTDFTLWQYRAAIDAQRLTDDDKRQQRIATLGFSEQHIQHAADVTTTTSYRSQLADCDAALHALQQLDVELARIIGIDSPSTALIQTTLEEIHDAMIHLAGERIAADVGAVSRNHEITIATDACCTTDVVPHLRPLVLQRHEAIAQLSEVARYFHTMEPHSPLASAIYRLVRWADMSCEELMRELIPDRNARDALSLMTGIAPESSSTVQH